MMATTDAAFAALMQTLQRGILWAPEARQWMWLTPGGQPQSGLAGLVAGDLPGLANLTWLAMSRDKCPKHFDLGADPLCMWVLAFASQPVGQHVTKVLGWPAPNLAACAEVLTLEQFADLPPLSGPVGQLIALARQRLGRP